VLIINLKILIHQATDTLDNIRRSFSSVKNRGVLDVVPETNESQNMLIRVIPRNPATDTLVFMFLRVMLRHFIC
jgi:hypothetical protein